MDINDLHAMPKDEEVTTLDIGGHSVRVIKITAENSSHLAQFALSMYAGEPCRICGELLTMDDLNDDSVFAGYSSDNAARVAHETCWKRSPMVDGIVPGDWVHQ